jgi:hypothetical protein
VPCRPVDPRKFGQARRPRYPMDAQPRGFRARLDRKG